MTGFATASTSATIDWRTHFDRLADEADAQRAPGETILLWFAAEHSDFVRFNTGRIRQTGRVLDAILVDDYYVDLTLLRSELKLIQAEGSAAEYAGFQAMLSPDFTIWDPINSIIRVTYDTMRERHMFAHRITRPSVQYYETAESAEGKPRLKYVPNLD